MACLISIHYITVVITMLFSQCASATVLPFPWKFLPEFHLGWRALCHVRWDQCCYFQSNWLTVSPSKHPAADSMSLVLALYLPHSLHFFSWWLLNSLIQSASQLFALKSLVWRLNFTCYILWNNFTVTLLITFVTEWLVALSTSSKIFWFCVLIILFITSSNSLKIVWDYLPFY